MIYIVNRKYYFTALAPAIEQAKQVLRERADKPINEIFKVTQGKKNGYCVALCDEWEKVGNKNLLKVVICVASIESEAK